MSSSKRDESLLIRQYDFRHQLSCAGLGVLGYWNGGRSNLGFPRGARDGQERLTFYKE